MRGFAFHIPKINLYRPSLSQAAQSLEELLSFHDSSVAERKPWHGLNLQRRNWFGLAEIIPSHSAGVPSLTWTGAE